MQRADHTSEGDGVAKQEAALTDDAKSDDIRSCYSGESSDSKSYDLKLKEDHFGAPRTAGTVAISKLKSPESILEAIVKCRNSVLETSENTFERKQLVKELIELRIRLQQIGDNIEVEPSQVEYVKVLFHQFILQSKISGRQVCDACGGLIWTVFHVFYKCDRCHYVSHTKCLEQVKRKCVQVQYSDNPNYIMDICPETNLLKQLYRCFECGVHISFDPLNSLSMFRQDANSNTYNTGVGNSYSYYYQQFPPRLCDYDGKYYCAGCHWNYTSVIPARVIHNWDFKERSVCQSCLQLLSIMKNTALFDLNYLNPNLFSFVEELAAVRKLRKDLQIVKRYVDVCKEARRTRLLEKIRKSNKTHLMNGLLLYSISDLQDIQNGNLVTLLEKTLARCQEHIRNECQLCSGQGHICELCEHSDVIFPFDRDISSCAQCGSVFHRECLAKKEMQAYQKFECPKCTRMTRREKQEDQEP